MRASKVSFLIDDKYEIPNECLKRLIQHDSSDKFTVIITSQKQLKYRIETTVNKARVISKKVEQLYQVDPTIDEYELELNSDAEIKVSILKKLFESIDSKIEFNLNEKIYIKELEELFGIPEFNIEINESEFKSIKESVSFLSTSLHDYSIKYLSSHMKKAVEEGDFFNLDEKICIEIIDGYFLQENQSGLTDDLYSKIVRKEKDFIFNSIQDEMSEDVVMHFLFQMNNDDYTEKMINYISDHLSDEIVKNELGQIIRQYLGQLIKKTDQTKTKKKKAYTKSKYSLDFEMNGIISYLQLTSGPDILNNGALKIKGGGVSHPYHPVSNIIDYDEKNNNYYINHFNYTPNKNDGFIEFDFGERIVNLKSYSIKRKPVDLKPHSLFNFECNPKSWEICGSNDGVNWEIIDSRCDDNSLNGSSNEIRFECNGNNNNNYRYIRYILHKTWHPDCDYFIDLTYIKLFGSISFKNINNNTRESLFD